MCRSVGGVAGEGNSGTGKGKSQFLSVSAVGGTVIWSQGFRDIDNVHPGSDYKVYFLR